jgi:AcrR family transcriptional regulator
LSTWAISTRKKPVEIDGTLDGADSGSCRTEEMMIKARRLLVRERTRRAVRAELALLAQELFTAQGYDQTTLDDFVAAAVMSKRTFFRYFSSKDDLVLGKYEMFGDAVTDTLDARPPDEPIWEALRRAFDVVADYFDDPALHAQAVAMEKMIHGTPALSAGEWERVSRVQNQLLTTVRDRIGQHDPADPRPATIAGAGMACVMAAKTAWITSNQAHSFNDLLDQAMATVKPT